MDFAFLAVVAVVTIVAVARFANKLRVAAPLILVLVGLALSYLPFVPDVEVKPE